MFYFLRASVMVSFAVKGGCLAPLANFEAARQGGLADGESPPGRRLPLPLGHLACANPARPTPSSRPCAGCEWPNPTSASSR